MRAKVGENPAVFLAAVFSLSSNLRGAFKRAPQQVAVYMSPLGVML